MMGTILDAGLLAHLSLEMTATLDNTLIATYEGPQNKASAKLYLDS